LFEYLFKYYKLKA